MNEITDINEYRTRKVKRMHCEKVNELLRSGRILIRDEVGKAMREAMSAMELRHGLPRWSRP